MGEGGEGGEKVDVPAQAERWRNYPPPSRSVKASVVGTVSSTLVNTIFSLSHGIKLQCLRVPCGHIWKSCLTRYLSTVGRICPEGSLSKAGMGFKEQNPLQVSLEQHS